MSTIPTGRPAKKGQSADTGQTTTSQTTAIVQATSSLGQIAPAMPSHAQVLTVTPLNNDATIVFHDPATDRRPSSAIVADGGCNNRSRAVSDSHAAARRCNRTFDDVVVDQQ